MSKFVRAALASAFVFAAVVPNAASAAPVPVVHPAAAGTSSAAGAAAAGGFIGFVALLDIYDIIRRTSCSGDFLSMGGPGFDSPVTPLMNVLPPQCAPAPKARHHKKH
jgi:hypothetical protein